jgi:tetratricopeptide (TPR) repeat protein
VALRELQEATQSAADAAGCWQTLGELALTSHEDTFIRAAEEGVSRRGCGADAECANRLVWVAGLEERRGNFRTALNYYQQAREKDPDRADIAEHTAGLAASLEMHALASDVYKSLARSSPGGSPDGKKWSELAAHQESLVRSEAVFRPAAP